MYNCLELNFENSFIDQITKLKEELSHLGIEFDNQSTVSIKTLILKYERVGKLKEALENNESELKEIKFIYSSIEMFRYEDRWVIYLSPLITDEICKFQLWINNNFKCEVQKRLFGNNPLEYSVVISKLINNKELSSAFKILTNDRLFFVSRIVRVRISWYENDDESKHNEWIKTL